MITGGTIAALIIATPHLLVHFDLSIFWRWGWIVALLGTILPPFLFNKGLESTGLGLATILSSIELPVAITTADTFLGESFELLQWIGVATIIAAILIANVPSLNRPAQE